MPAGYDLLGLICGSEGQLGVVTEATLRILRKPEGARPVLMGFDSARWRRLRVRHHQGRVLPVAIEFMDRPCIRACEAFAKAGYPMCEALLIVEVEGSEAEIDEQLGLILQIARGTTRSNCAKRDARTKPRDLAGPQIGLRRDGADQRLHVPRRHDPGVELPYVLRASARCRRSTGWTWPTCFMPATATCIR
jgi:glycolate oxidase